jgi:host factor-I protein
LHELHELELHDEQPEEVCFPPPLMPKTENFFVISSELQAGQHTIVLPKTSFSKSAPQEEHLYSNIGIRKFLLPYDFIIPLWLLVLELLTEIVYFNTGVFILTVRTDYAGGPNFFSPAATCMSLEGGFMPENKNHNLQELFLNQARKEKIPVVIFLTSGIRLKGIIKGFDNFVVLLKETNEQLIYKHAISTIVPEKPVEIRVEDGDK